MQVEGRISAVREAQVNRIAHTQYKIASIQKNIACLEKKAPRSEKLHQKKRRLVGLQRGLERLQSEKAEGKVPLCFGSRRLFRAQFALEENGYQSHEEWSADWHRSRNNSFLFVGSKDESSGNQTCTAMLVEGDKLVLRLRLPPALASRGKYLLLPPLHFKYGHKDVVEALKSCEERKQLTTLKSPDAKQCGVALSYRFRRVFISLPLKQRKRVTSQRNGVIGVDVNATHLAIAETDRFGNAIAIKTIPLNTYGQDRNQTRALVGDACALIIEAAEKAGKPLVVERLNFQEKKAMLRDYASPTLARMLSSLAYGDIINGLRSRAWKSGVEVLEVNPAYTSIIGRVKFSKRYGLSVHHAAALVIGRRHLKVSERVPRHLDSIPDGKGGHVALSLPVRNRDKHVWHIWRMVNRNFKTVLAAHFRAMKHRSSSSKSASVTHTTSNLAGEIPAGESVNTTARLASLTISTTMNA
jgi:IS605 OrfB family transposase